MSASLPPLTQAPEPIRAGAPAAAVVTPPPTAQGALALQAAETRELVDLLSAAYPSSSELMTLADIAGINKGMIDRSGSNRAVVYNIVRQASAQGRLRQLIDVLLTELPSSAERARLEALLGESAGSRGPREPSEVASADPLETAWLPNGAPLVNRTQLRKGVRDLLSPDGRRILIVNGPPGSGKSYSAAFISSVQQATGLFKLALVRYEPASWLDYGPADLARSLGDILSVELPPRPADMDPRAYHRWIVTRLVSAVAASGQTWWWVLDGFFSVAHDDVTDFIESLIQFVAREPHLRLVLLGYEQPLSPQAVTLAVREDISPLTEADVRDFLTRPSLTARRTADEESIEESIRTIFTGLPAGERRNVTLGVRVLRASGQFTR